MHVAQTRADAILALTTLQFTKSVAIGAVDDALAEVGRGAELERLVFAALRRCPKPS